MKRITFTLVVILLSVTASAQHTFEKLVHNGEYWMNGISAVNDSDGGFIIHVNYAKPNEYSFSGLVHIDEDGQTIDTTLCLTDDGRLMVIHDLIPNPDNDNTFYAAGMSYSAAGRLTDIAVAVFDHGLNMTKCTVFEMDTVIADATDTDNLLFRAILNPDGHIVIAGHVQMCDGQYGYFFARVSPEGTLERFVTDGRFNSQYAYMFDIFTLREDPLEYGLTCVTPNEENNGGVPDMYVLDGDFNEVESRPIVHFQCGENIPYQTYALSGFTPVKMLALNDSTCYTFSSIYYYNYSSIIHGIGAMRFNRDFEIDRYSFTDNISNETFSGTSVHSAFYIDDDGIVGCGEREKGSLYNDKVCLIRYDSDLNVVWQRVYRKNGYYMDPVGVIKAEDGGSLILCWGRKNSSSVYWRDLYVLKVDGDGGVTDCGEAIEAIPFLCYPNPASSTLHMDISPDVIDQMSEISLYDVSGRLVKTQQSGFGSIDISGLATGMYVMKVTLDDGKVFEEKIVKE